MKYLASAVLAVLICSAGAHAFSWSSLVSKTAHSIKAIFAPVREPDPAPAPAASADLPLHIPPAEARYYLEHAEPELAADLIENGICLAGGGALLRRLNVVLSNTTGLDVNVAEDPLTSVARGTSIYLENLELWKDTLESDDTNI